jgi:hypothetical protein
MQKGEMHAPTVRTVTTDPQWIPHTYDVTGTNLTFVHVPRPDRAKLMFLSDGHFDGNFEKATFPAEAVRAEIGTAEAAPINFIFHTSFCGSTLLTKALDVPGTSAVLKEPDVLHNLANFLIGSDDQSNRQRLELVLRLLERPLAPGESVIVKPTNFANRLLEPMLAMRPRSNAVLLYSDVETYARSLLKRGMFGRIVARKLFGQLRQWSPLHLGFSDAALFDQTDVQIAALVWLMQIHHFDAMARRFGPRVMLVDTASFLADPAATLNGAQALFGLGLAQSEVDSIASGPVFATHSKFADREYNFEVREKDHRDASEAHAEELEMVVEWIQAVAKTVGAPLKPGL